MKINNCPPCPLNDNELKLLNKRIKKLPKRYKKFPIKYTFINSGIGIAITVECGNKFEDITDYESW